MGARQPQREDLRVVIGRPPGGDHEYVLWLPRAEISWVAR